MILLEKNEPKQMNADGYKELIFSSSALSPEFMSGIICNVETNILLRRQLSLFMVLFQNNFGFEFDKANNFVPKKVLKYTIKE